MLEFRPPLIGREAELSFLLQHLERARSGHGGTVLVSGEVGIGKTRLLEELKARARSMRVQVLAGFSLYESLTPYMPFFEALRSGGLEHLLAEHAPRIEGVYLLTDTGLLIKSVVRTESTKLDSDVFAGMLSTVNNFVRESLAKLRVDEGGDAMRRLDYGDYSILVEHGAGINLAVIITGKETEFLISDMKSGLEDVHREYGKRLGPWSGEEQDVAGLESLLLPLLAKYDGLSYAEADPQARRDLLFENVSLGLTRQTTMSAVLLCLEDLQWADPSTLALVHYIANTASKRGLLIVGTYRPEDLTSEDGRTHHLTVALQRMSRDNLFETMKLERLPEDSSAVIIRSLLEAPDLDRVIVHRLHTEAEGNPFFTIELTKLMVEEGILRRADAGWIAVRDLAQADIPVRIHDVVARRVTRLDEDLRSVLDCASVIGEEYNSDVLASALHIEKMSLLKALAILERRHRLVRPRNGHYRFDHVKIKEVLYDDLPAELRMEYHWSVATAMEGLEDATGSKAGDIAFHYLRSKTRNKALPYLLKAAKAAAREFANTEAIRFYSEALEVTEEKGNRMEILVNIGELHSVRGSYGESLESYEKAVELADNSTEKARILAKIADIYYRRGEIEESLRRGIQALNLVPEDAIRERALAFNTIGAAYNHRGDIRRALENLDRAMELWERTKHEGGTVRCLNLIGTSYYFTGEFSKAVENLEKALRVSEEIGDVRSRRAPLNNLGNLRGSRGDLEGALECYKGTLFIAEKTGNQDSVAGSLVNIGLLYAERGDFERALTHMNKALAIAEGIGALLLVAISRGSMAAVRFRLGEYGTALAESRRCLELAERVQSPEQVAECLETMGNIMRKIGDNDGALSSYRRCLAIAEESGYRERTASCLSSVGNFHYETGNFDAALDAYSNALAIGKEVGIHAAIRDASYGIASILLEKGESNEAEAYATRAFESISGDAKNEVALRERLLGKIHRERKKWIAATKCLEESVRLFGELKMRPDEGESEYELGLTYKLSGDHEKSKEHLEVAISTFEMLGQSMSLKKARQALEARDSSARS